jgi:hypothetical protein
MGQEQHKNKRGKGVANAQLSHLGVGGNKGV